MRGCMHKWKRKHNICSKRSKSGTSLATWSAKVMPCRAIYQLIETAAKSDIPVLVQGETGTGKELAARAIHYNSTRKDQRFLSQNCATLSPELLQSELFGHKKGAFTGATEDHKGIFEAANGGTVFLDEIADAPPQLQRSLLRVLQEGEIRRVGETEDREVDVRIIAATNQRLKKGS